MPKRRKNLNNSKLEAQYLEVMKKYIEKQTFSRPLPYEVPRQLEEQHITTVVTYGAYEFPV